MTKRLGRAAQRRRFVLGFCFNETETRVALMIKTHTPVGADDMAHTFNGLGGEARQHETYEHAMAREFYEEGGVVISMWQLFAVIEGDTYRVQCFRVRATREQWRRIKTLGNSKTDEQVVRMPVGRLTEHAYKDLHWLVPLAIASEAVVRIDRRSF